VSLRVGKRRDSGSGTVILRSLYYANKTTAGIAGTASQIVVIEARFSVVTVAKFAAVNKLFSTFPVTRKGARD